jgi:hypothetical protein
MPSTSAKQAKFMRAIAHSPLFAKKVGVKQSVGKDFEMADKKMKKFGSGGGVTKQMPTSDAMGSMGMAKGGSAKGKAKAKGKAMMAAAMMKDRMGRAMAARGAEAPMAPAGPPMGMGMKKGGKAKAKPFAATKFGAAMMKKSGDTEGRAMKKMAKGGSIDGIATKGKTKGKMMAMGGMAGYKHGGKTH